MIHIPLWLAALLGMVSLTLAIGAIMVLVLQQKSKPKPPNLPDEWALTGRAVFSTNERRIFRLLHATLSQHVILAKIPMVRFCQPIDFGRTRYWYDLLGSNYVSFAICAPNGRVLAAIDIDKDRHGDETNHLKLSMKIKRAALRSCRIRYLRVPAGATLTESEIKLLVSPARGFFDETPLKKSESGFTLSDETRSPEGGKLANLTAETTARLVRARESLASAVASRRAQRNHLWGESNSLFHDSFFALDSRLTGSDAPESSPILEPSLTEKIDISMQSTPESHPVSVENLSNETDRLTIFSPEIPHKTSPIIHEQGVQTSFENTSILTTRPFDMPLKKFEESRHERRQPPVVNVTLEDVIPSEQIQDLSPSSSSKINA